MTEDQLFHLLGLALLFAFSAFFSGSETALTAIDRLRVKYLVQKNRRGAARLELLLDHPDRLLSAILVGNNLVNIAASVFSTTLLVELFGPRGEWLTIVILTPLLLIFSEISPKIYAAQCPEKVSFLVLRPILFVMWLLRPVVWMVSGISRMLTRVLRSEESRPLISEDEIRSIITVGEQSGAVDKKKKHMLHGVIELSQIRVRDVMIPRTEVVGIDVSLGFDQVLPLVQEARHSRFPVYEGNLDNIVGIIHSKDILNFVDRAEDFSLRDVARAPYFVPDSKPVETLLQSFLRRRVHLAVVVDEYGGVDGIVTLEDIFEQIVGEIQDEYDVEEVLVRELDSGSYLLDGSVSLRMVNRRFGLEFSEEHANTLAGFLLRVMGTIPEEGDSCQADGVTLVARKVVDRRVEEVEMVLPPDFKLPT